MIIKLEDAGFNTGFTSIYWCYATGFPKAQDISKVIDKKLGGVPEVIGVKKRTGSAYMKEQEHYQMEDGKAIDGRDSELIRKRVESMKSDGVPITVPSTDKAKEFNGSYAGFQPKPAVEIIIVVMKPLSEKTYVDQCLNNGKGVTWLGECRIPYKDESDNLRVGNTDKSDTNTYGWAGTSKIYKSGERNDEGRFPANLLVSDDCLNDGITHKSGDLKPEYNLGAKTKGIYGELERKPESVKGDSGSFSRYFNLDAWFMSKLPEQAQKTYPYLIVPKPAKSEKNKYCENKHPTVKPLKLMSYLITMGSREGDLILDPFAGSGTTLEAARVLNRKFVGCELTEEYKEIIEARAGVSISPYRNIIEVPEYTEASLDDLERTLEDTERESYEDMLIEAPCEVFDSVRRAYWKGKGY
jgi:site-specific DNA-methyltransferase (adenine-specific)